MPLRDLEDLCVFHIRQRKGNWDHAEIQREILKQGKKYDVSDVGREHIALYADMTLPAQIILKLTLHNIRPKSHSSSTTTDVTPLIYYILSGRLVDIARIISQKLKLVTLSGRFGAKCQLAFPILIMGLVLDAKICIPVPVHEELKGPIDDKFISRLEGKDKKGKKKETSPTRILKCLATSTWNLNPLGILLLYICPVV